MKISTAGLVALIGHEGIVLTRYKDSVGVWTIGVGHTKAAGGLDPASFTGTLSMAEALDLLRTDIVKYENGVNAAVKVPLKQHEFDALVSFHYNTGGVARASLTRSLNAGDRKTAGAQFMNWTTPKEITERREAEMTLFLTGEYPKPMAMVWPASPGGALNWSKGTRVNVLHLLGKDAVTDPEPEVDPVFERVRQVQSRLTEEGFPCGAIDGLIGPKTRDAIAAFQLARKITPDILDAATAAALGL